MLTQYTLKVPRGVYSGQGALDHVKKIVGKCATKVTVFSDQGTTGADLPEEPLSLIKKVGMRYSVLDELPTEPDCDQAQAVINRLKAEKSGLIVAVDGGSVTDIAKLASVFTTDAYTVRGLLDSSGPTGKCVPTFMISTTTGTDSGATPSSIVVMSEKEPKVGAVNDAMVTDYVILDGEMIRHLPRKIAATTRVDALTREIGCYTSNRVDPLSGTFALEALDLVFNHIERACDDPDALDAKNAILTAAFYTGAVVTASGTTAVHALSYPLGGRYHIPHDISDTMLLIPIVKLNEPAYRERLATVYNRMAKGERESGLPPEERSAWIIRRLDEIVKHLGIPNSLREYGVEDGDLDILVEAGTDAKWFLVNNMREVTAEDARKLYLEIIR